MGPKEPSNHAWYAAEGHPLLEKVTDTIGVNIREEVW
jgi:hypothetical protein